MESPSAKSEMQRVAGHRINGRVYEYPHLCPGEQCAIAAWLAGKYARGAYECEPTKTWPELVANELEKHQ